VHPREVRVHPGGSCRGHSAAAGAGPHSSPIHENSKAEISLCFIKVLTG